MAKSPTVQATQVQREPLERLQQMFGGSLNQYNGYHRWGLYGTQAAGVLMTLYTLMSPRRKGQIAAALEHWKTLPGGPRSFKWESPASGNVPGQGRNTMAACNSKHYQQ